MSLNNLLTLLLFTLTLVEHSYCQLSHEFKSINDNSKITYLDSIKEKKENIVIFFCPINDIDSSIFIERGKELVSNNKISSFQSLKIHFILFKEDPKNNSKGILLSSKDKTNTIINTPNAAGNN